MKDLMENWRSYNLSVVNEKTRYEKETGKKYDPTPEFEQKITDHPTQYAFTMTDIQKVGINPRTDFQTPAGVYFYPLDKQRYEELVTNTLPFASDRAYCGLVKLNLQDKNKWLIIQQGNNQPESAIQKTLNFLKTYNLSQEQINKIYSDAQKEGRSWQQTNVDGKIFIITYFASDILNSIKGIKRTIVWRQLLIDLGYIGAYDTGMKVIHPSEPTQLFCLTTSAFQVVEIYETRILRKGQAISSGEELGKKFQELLRLPPEQRYFSETATFNGSSVRIPAGIRFKEINVTPLSSVTIPDNLIVEQDLILEGTQIVSFGKNVKIGGILNMSACQIRNFPINIEVGGTIYANKIKTAFNVVGPIKSKSIMMGYSNIQSFLAQEIDGELDLKMSSIKQLAPTLKVKGQLNLTKCKQLTSLPENLIVGEDLILEGSTGITELPNNLTVFGNVIVDDINKIKINKKISVGGIYSNHDGQEKNYRKFGQGLMFINKNKFFPEKKLDEMIIEEINILIEKRKLGKPSSETNLGDWFKRKGAPGKKGGWVDCNTCRDGKCKPCGRQSGEKRSKYPRCRPTPSQCKGYKRRGSNLQKEE